MGIARQEPASQPIEFSVARAIESVASNLPVMVASLPPFAIQRFKPN
jgi:hypothetical protein